MSRPVITTPRGELEVLMTREFEAPRRLVFDAWTRPELLREWLGVRAGWTMSLCEIDLRVGGTYRYLWRHEDGKEMGVRGVFREITAPDRVVCTEKFDDPWYAGEARITHALEEVEGVTTCTLTLLYETKQTRDGVLASPMESGVAEGYTKLDELLTRPA